MNKVRDPWKNECEKQKPGTGVLTLKKCMENVRMKTYLLNIIVFHHFGIDVFFAYYHPLHIKQNKNIVLKNLQFEPGWFSLIQLMNNLNQ